MNQNALTQLRTIANALPIGGAATLPRDFLLLACGLADTTEAATPPSDKNADTAASTKWITAKDAAERLGVARSMLYKPFHRRFARRVGTRALRYDAAAIDRHMAKSRL